MAGCASCREPLSGSTDPDDAGNGSLMRLSPVAIRWWRDRAKAVEAARLQSRTTHGAVQAVEACALFAEILVESIAGHPKECDAISSSGYVLHTLEAALWCVGRTESVADALILAVNLGHDADTVGAVTGQLAGALWGMSGAPTDWLDRLAWCGRIEWLAAGLFHSTEVRNPGRWTAPPGGILRNAEGVIIDPPPGPLRDRLVACTRAWTTYRRRGDPRPLIALGLFPEGSPWVDPETLEPLDPQPNPDDLGPALDPYTPLPGG